ncbi:hypothetical protein LJC25_03930 [Bacteroidales bacterium OttesenSCG-928-K03]|nr:hypothetical protein [Bacteroidales bacterium OttesenSCG-928-L14]MDL2242858.1 hypothetical protein [Bacteroidales bacterium OttesenSCG-928-K03]
MNENPLFEEDINSCDLIERSRVLILFDKKNIDVNYVAKCLINVCEHSPLQAKQCAIMSRVKGNCNIASGTHQELSEKRDKLIVLGLNAKIGF